MESQLVNPGECVNFPHITNILLGVTLLDGLIVDCSSTWDFRVLNNFEVDRTGDYPDDLYFKRQAFSNCDRHYTLQIPPSEESWADGDRVITCLQESWGLDRHRYSDLDRRVTGKLRAGECVRLRAGSFDVVPCDEEEESWHFQVVSTITLEPDDDEYPGERSFEQHYLDGCDTELADDFLFPDKRYWELGDRSIHCVKIKRATTTEPLQGGP